MARRLRKGMWVTYEGRIGIINAFHEVVQEGAPPIEMAEFHRVHEDGTTLAIINVPSASVVQATLNEIPEARRPAADRAALFGYK